jgi:hypothetical protein
MDRIDQLAERAAQGLPLFTKSRLIRNSEIVAQEFWTARNGYRHATEIVRLVGKKKVTETHKPPYLDPVREKRCKEKRDYRLVCKKRRGWLKRQCEVKAASRARTGRN